MTQILHECQTKGDVIAIHDLSKWQMSLPSFMSICKGSYPTKSGIKTIWTSFYKAQQQHLFEGDVSFCVFISDYVQVDPDKNLLVG